MAWLRYWQLDRWRYTICSFSLSISICFDTNRSFESTKSQLVCSPSCGLKSLPGGFQISGCPTKNSTNSKNTTLPNIFMHFYFVYLLCCLLFWKPKDNSVSYAFGIGLGILVPGVHDQLQQVQTLTTWLGLYNREATVVLATACVILTTAFS